MTRSEFLKLLGGAGILLLCGCQDDKNQDKAKKEQNPKEDVPPPETKCTADFVNGTNHANPDCDPKKKTLDNRCTGKLYKLIYPGSQYDNAAGRKLADDELKRATDFYAQYCIDLTVEEITLPDKVATGLKNAYAAWLADVINDIGGKDKLGKTSIPSGDRDNFHKIANTIQKHAQDEVKPKGLKLVIVFMDEYIGGSDGRDTLVSSTQEDIMQIGINWIDSGSKYILAHELIHALGKAGAASVGKVTWPHSSNCPGKALSRIERTDSRATIDLSDRVLDVQEYLEIGTNRAAGLLKCHKIK
jgi:hypothetical protein